MKQLLTISAIMLGAAAVAQTYPKYTNEAGGNNNISKTAKQPKKEQVQTPVVEEPKKDYKEMKIDKTKQADRIEMIHVEAVDNNSDDFQKLMERAVVQNKMKNFNAAISLYTQALNVASEEQVWRALVSRSTTYTVMDKPNIDKALADLTTIIDSQNAPQKQLAYIYSSRARLLYDKNEIEKACADVQKARDLGLPEQLIVGVEKCK